MKTNDLYFKGLFLIAFLFMQGCASQLDNTKSGFLGDYSRLQDNKEYENSKIYVESGFDNKRLASIQSIKLEPFEVWLEANLKSAFNANQLADIVHYFHKTMSQKLGENYQLVQKADENTLTIRGAFSGIKFSDPKLSVTDFVPFRIVLNAGNAAYLMATEQKDIFTEISIETEFLLGSDNHRVFAMTATKEVEGTINKNGDDNVKTVTEVLDIWIDNFITRLKKVRE
ncbi:MAG: hypothetical protein ACJASL_002856 [Paraglaciecola sp.]|jgi:hypothetical protein